LCARARLRRGNIRFCAIGEPVGHAVGALRGQGFAVAGAWTAFIELALALADFCERIGAMIAIGARKPLLDTLAHPLAPRLLGRARTRCRSHQAFDAGFQPLDRAVQRV